ncbi:hypothetical protein EPUS_02243 [Endocarpon pusillum Z07020]|uniref:Protein HRI1 n=1 Tax=Endocarpon pusillum (strain Z07020 / HMAS-L-300199) TaxID=1263415 RepID=U1I3S5_ENDPU|nr:uncharacterized protein EPUS_02243 [Endocarpon pusillum Z07020]ERF76704.1 hypothetical protein EPUS_02243 [Endocarpon pusillum Z07020]
MQIFGVTGESLGRIGTEAKQEREQAPEPEWKGILVAKPSVSVRKGIAWGTNPPSEPTSTLVLTSAKSYYVDIRFSLTGPTATSPPHYWAFAGTSKSTFPPRNPISPPHHPTPPPTRETHPISFPCSTHTTWTRFLDSRGDITTPDDGTTYLLHNGDCLETGQMINPDTRILQSYQELWTSPPANDVEQRDRASDGEQRLTRDESPPTQHQSTGSEVKVKAIVALLHRRPQPPHLATESGSGSASGSEVKGMIVRIGNYCQGIIEVPPSTSSDVESGVCHPSTAQAGSVRVERWRFNSKTDSILSGIGTGEVLEEEGKRRRAEGEDGEVGKWTRDERSTYQEDKAQGIWMPCLWVCEGKRRVGDSTEKEGFVGTWRIVEAEGW